MLYGVSYYHEYMPYERLEKDVELMQKAGVTVVRLGESTWSSFEPKDGVFEFAWMDRILDRLHKAGIKVIFGTPTYSIPPWLFKKHPDIVVTRFGTAPPMSDPYSGTYPSSVTPGAYGPRQNMDLTHPEYRRHAERIIRALMAHYKDHPAIVGYQVDNETGPNGLPLANVQKAFVEYLKEKYGSVAELNRLWGFVYWGQLVQSWDELPSRDGILNPGYKLDWERYQRKIVTDFLSWQAAIVREYKRPEQFVTHNFVGGIRTNLDQWAIAKSLDVAAVNPYHSTQDRLDLQSVSLSGDLCRSLKQQSYLVTETNAQGIGWDSRAQYPPYDGQLAAVGVCAPGERGEHGGLLALAFAALRAGDVLEGSSVARPGTEQGVRGDVEGGRGAEEDRTEAGESEEVEQGGDSAGPRLVPRDSVHAVQRPRELYDCAGADVRCAVRTECRAGLCDGGDGGLVAVQGAARAAVVRGGGRAAGQGGAVCGTGRAGGGGAEERFRE